MLEEKLHQILETVGSQCLNICLKQYLHLNVTGKMAKEVEGWGVRLRPQNPTTGYTAATQMSLLLPRPWNLRISAFVCSSYRRMYADCSEPKDWFFCWPKERTQETDRMDLALDEEKPQIVRFGSSLQLPHRKPFSVRLRGPIRQKDRLGQVRPGDRVGGRIRSGALGLGTEDRAGSGL